MSASRALLVLLLATSSAALHADWLGATVLSDCGYCSTDAFADERKRLANQSGPPHDPASGMGYIVSIERDGPFVWGRAALVGTGNLIRTAAHVMVSDSGKPKAAELYFEPMHHRGLSQLIEIDLDSLQRGASVGPGQDDIRNDWAIARLEEDVIEKFGGRSVFAFLWDLPVTHDEVNVPETGSLSSFVLSHEVTYRLRHCRTVVDDHPSSYGFDSKEIFFLACPTHYLRVGVSGSTLAIPAQDDSWHLGGQLIAGGMSEFVRVGSDGRAESGGALGHQVFLGNGPAFRQALNRAYLQELIRRGIDPRIR